MTATQGCRVTWTARASDPSVQVTYSIQQIESGTFRGTLEQSWLHAGTYASRNGEPWVSRWRFDVGVWNQEGVKSVNPPPECTVF